VRGRQNDQCNRGESKSRTNRTRSRDDLRELSRSRDRAAANTAIPARPPAVLAITSLTSEIPMASTPCVSSSTKLTPAIVPAAFHLTHRRLMPVDSAESTGINNGTRWRWRESNPRPSSPVQGFSGCSAAVLFSAPAVTQASCRRAQSLFDVPDDPVTEPSGGAS
jgi:hypothetical protein